MKHAVQQHHAIVPQKQQIRGSDCLGVGFDPNVMVVQMVLTVGNSCPEQSQDHMVEGC